MDPVAAMRDILDLLEDMRDDPCSLAADSMDDLNEKIMDLQQWMGKGSAMPQLSRPMFHRILSFLHYAGEHFAGECNMTPD